jgi:hypothetical protein
MAQKLDLMKDLHPLYRPPVREPVVVEVPAFSFLMVDGAGDPNTSPKYAQAVEALYAASYGAKFMVKRAPEARTSR